MAAAFSRNTLIREKLVIKNLSQVRSIQQGCPDDITCPHLTKNLPYNEVLYHFYR